jgi:hypothetical protein
VRRLLALIRSQYLKYESQIVIGARRSESGKFVSQVLGECGEHCTE